MFLNLLAQEGGTESLIQKINYGSSYTDVVPYVCAVLVFASGVYGLMTARRNPNYLTHAMLLHGFVLLTVTAVAAGCVLLGYYTSMKTFMTSGSPDPRALAGDQSVVAMIGIRNAVIVAAGGVLGAVALLLKPPPECR